MLHKNSGLIVCAATAAMLLGASCSSTDAGAGDGNAEWDRPPLEPPGGNGEAGDDGGDDGDSDPGGDGGGDDGGGSGGGDDGWSGDDGGTGSGGTDTGGWGTTGGTTDGGTATDTGGGFVCEPDPSSGTAACDQNPGVCETPMDSTGDMVAPCCDDPDCGCMDGNCDVEPCAADGYCDCLCLADPDCGAGECGIPMEHEPRSATCPDEREPVVMYMSNDDSNSQASPVLVRQLVAEGQEVSPNVVRIHEFLNYYDLSYQNPNNAALDVGMQMRRIGTEEFALLLYAQGRKLDDDDRRPMNLVLSLDTSGSMSGHPMRMLKASMRAMAGSLREGDIISIVEWSENQDVPLASYVVDGPDDITLLSVIDSLATGGSTDLHGGLLRAYNLAKLNYSSDRINRVILVSDGGANTGITDIELIADAADDSNGEGIYLLGVGASEASQYRDDLMDDVTDAGKGAYVFIDSAAEAEKIFGERFIQTVDVAARDVQMELTLPWYFGIKEFHGEEYSADPAEVEPQHLSPNDAMSYHQVVEVCDADLIALGDTVEAKARYVDPTSRDKLSDSKKLTIQQLYSSGSSQLYKGDVVVAYAQAFIVIGDELRNGRGWAGADVADAMAGWLDQAAKALDDDEVVQMAALMALYASQLESRHG